MTGNPSIERHTMAVIVDKKTGEFLGILPVYPW